MRRRRWSMHLPYLRYLAAASGTVVVRIAIVACGSPRPHADGGTAALPTCQSSEIVADLERTLAPAGVNVFLVRVEDLASKCGSQGYAMIEVRKQGEWKRLRLTDERNPMGTVMPTSPGRAELGRGRAAYIVITQAISPGCNHFLPVRLELPHSTGWTAVGRLALWGCTPVDAAISPIVGADPTPRGS